MSDDLTQITEDSAKGSFFLIGGQVTAFALEAIGVFVLARLLGPEPYGIYVLALIFPSLVVEMNDLGVDQATIRYSANLRRKGQYKEIARLIRHGLLLKVLLGLVSFGICFLFSDYLAYLLQRPEISVYIRLASIMIIFRVFSTTAFAVFVGLDKTHYYALTTNVQSFFKASISILLVAFGLGVSGAIIGVAASFVILGVLSSVLFYSKLYRPLKSKKGAEVDVKDSWTRSLKKMISYGGPLYISQALGVIITQLQTLLLAIFTLDYDIGNFKASSNFISMLSALILPLALSLFPAFSKLETNNGKAKTFFRICIKYASIFAVPPALLMVVLSREIVQIVYGASFGSAPIYLSLHAMIFLLVGLGFQVQKSLFNGLGEPVETFKIVLIQFVSFVSLAFYLTSTLGVVGLIVAILVSNIISTVYGAYRAKSKFEVKFNYKSLIRIYMVALMSALLAFLCARFLPFSVILRVLTAGAVYLVSYLTMLPLAHAVTRQELERIEQIASKIRPLRSITSLVLKYEYAIIRTQKDMRNF